MEYGHVKIDLLQEWLTNKWTLATLKMPCKHMEAVWVVVAIKKHKHLYTTNILHIQVQHPLLKDSQLIRVYYFFWGTAVIRRGPCVFKSALWGFLRRVWVGTEGVNQDCWARHTSDSGERVQRKTLSTHTEPEAPSVLAWSTLSILSHFLSLNRSKT